MNIIKRILASLVDYFLLGMFLMVAIVIFGEKTGDAQYSLSGAAPMIILLLICFAYLVLMEYFFQATLGHMIFGLKVVPLYGEKLTFMKAFRRRTADIVDIYLSAGWVALIAALVTGHHQRLGDLWAKTIVVDRKVADFSDRLETEFLVDNEEEKTTFRKPGIS